MHTAASADWRFDLILHRDVRTPAARADIVRRAQRGELIRVTRGAYLPAELWRNASRDERYRTRVRAVAALASNDLVLSHASAVSVWGLPWLGAWPDRVDALAPGSSGGQSTRALFRHVPASNAEPVVIDGLFVTDLARTVIDIAKSRGFSRAVVVGDAALNDKARAELAISASLDRRMLFDELDRSNTAYAASRARDVVTFLDGLSGSPGESVSRVAIWRAGIPAPVLQQSFEPWCVDFWWPDFGVIGEFDGAVKYRDERYLSGRPPADVVLDEKEREDELRRRSRGFARWGWDVASSPAALAQRLLRAGIPVR